MPATEAQVEAARIAVVCNACRYCEGLCAVFPAIERRTSFAAGDLDYLANLCHACGACYYDCQYAPPHPFAVNVPLTLATLRAESYARYAWPRALASAFARNGLATALIAALASAAFLAAFAGAETPREGAIFYRLMPHWAMVTLFGAAFLYAMAALALGVRAFWRAGGPSAAAPGAFAAALRDAHSLRNLHGGGAGCMNEDERPRDRRRLYHHLTLYGFLLCFAATAVATLYHFLLGREAPYPWYDLPVLLGSAGGLGLLIGPAGLLAAKLKRDPAIDDRARRGMDIAFIALLFLVSLSGMALLLLRATPAMGTLLALHLGLVLALFLTLPYGKFVHGLYRAAALLRAAREQRGAP